VGRDARDLKGLTIGAIGPATAAEFERAGIKVDFVPRQYRAEGLLEALQGRKVAGKSFLIPRAKVARDLVPTVLSGCGARVEIVAAYETVVPRIPAGEMRQMLMPPPHVITFTSSSTATHFAQMLGDVPISNVLSGVAIASIGPITSETLRKLGLNVDIEAKESTIPGLVAALINCFSNRK
jgi:uroporphyrinogen III methyltransferase/synthase